jgi:hypothetical protein
LIVNGAAFCRNNGKIEAPYTIQCLYKSIETEKAGPFGSLYGGLAGQNQVMDSD